LLSLCSPIKIVYLGNAANALVGHERADLSASQFTQSVCIDNKERFRCVVYKRTVAERKTRLHIFTQLLGT